MRVYITGCARSGTTLLRRMFLAFDNVDVIPEEIQLRRFLLRGCKGRHIVGKRSRHTLFSNSRIDDRELQISKIEKARRRGGLRIVNVIRDGRDILTTGEGPRRWIKSLTQAEEYAHLIDATVRYEDLILAPNSVQASLADTLGLYPVALFSSYPYFFSKDAVSHMDGYEPRPLATDRMNKTPADGWQSLCEEKYHAQFEKYLKLHGYL